MLSAVMELQRIVKLSKGKAKLRLAMLILKGDLKMSVSKWRYTEECDGNYCCGDCDLCDKEPRAAWKYIGRSGGITNSKIYECEICGHRVLTAQPDECPNCGAEMRGTKDE